MHVRSVLSRLAVAAALALIASWTGAMGARADSALARGAVLGTIPLDTNPTALAVDERTGHIFVAGHYGSLYMLDARSGRILHSEPGYADDFAVDEAANRVYVAYGGSNEMMTLDGTSGVEVPFIATVSDHQPTLLMLDTAQGQLYAVDYLHSAVTVYSSRSGRLVRQLTVGSHPAALALDRRSGHIFITADNTISMIDARSGAVVRTIPTSQYAGAVVVSASTGRAFATAFGENGSVDSLYVIDTASGRLLNKIALNGCPGALAVDERTGRVFVVRFKAAMVNILDARSGAVEGQTAVGAFPLKLAVDTLTGRAFVLNYDGHSVSVLDAHSGALLRTIAVGRNPDAIAVAEQTGRVFVANYAAKSVSILDAT